MYRTAFVMLTAVTLGLTACGKDAGGNDQASHISQVRSMHLSTNDCPAGVRKALQEHGFAIVDEDKPADARLEVHITRTGRNLQNVPEFGGFGAKASFSAQVIGAEDKVLFATAGEEGSLSSEEMCQDIGDELAEKLRGSPLGTVN